MMVTFFYVFINLMRPEYKTFSVAFIVCLFIFYTWRRILTILITAVIAFALISFFPFLAPVAFIIMLVIFFARLSYIIDNWRAVLAGFYMYGMAAFFGLHWYMDLPYRFFLRYFFSISPVYAAAIAFMVTLGFHLIMLWLYHNHYSLKRAMPIMGVAPLLIILLLMPFVKAIDGFDTMDTVDTTDAPMDTADAPADVYDYAHHSTPDTPAHDVVDAPGVHHTSDYFRTGPDGSLQHVDGYEATNPDDLEIMLLQMVTLLRDGKPVKMSKRTGEAVTLRELMEEVGTDAARYFFCARTLDSQMDFDIDLAKKHSNENPVYYIQYANARIHSLFSQAEEAGVTWDKSFGDTDFTKLTEECELDLIKKMENYHQLVAGAAQERAPQRIAKYAYELAALFHHFYRECRILGVDSETTKARLGLITAVQYILVHALHILGLSAPEHM